MRLRQRTTRSDSRKNQRSTTERNGLQGACALLMVLFANTKLCGPSQTWCRGASKSGKQQYVLFFRVHVLAVCDFLHDIFIFAHSCAHISAHDRELLTSVLCIALPLPKMPLTPLHGIFNTPQSYPRRFHGCRRFVRQWKRLEERSGICEIMRLVRSYRRRF